MDIITSNSMTCTIKCILVVFMAPVEDKNHEWKMIENNEKIRKWVVKKRTSFMYPAVKHMAPNDVFKIPCARNKSSIERSAAKTIWESHTRRVKNSRQSKYSSQARMVKRPLANRKHPIRLPVTDKGWRGAAMLVAFRCEEINLRNGGKKEKRYCSQNH